jgi:hypothetical protein
MVVLKLRWWHQQTPQPLINSLHRAYVLSIIWCALVNDYVAYYLPFGCRRHDLVRSFTTLTKLLLRWWAALLLRGCLMLSGIATRLK